MLRRGPAAPAAVPPFKGEEGGGADPNDPVVRRVGAWAASRGRLEELGLGLTTVLQWSASAGAAPARRYVCTVCLSVHQSVRSVPSAGTRACTTRHGVPGTRLPNPTQPNPTHGS